MVKLEETLVQVDALRSRPEAAGSVAELESAAHLTLVINRLWNYWRSLLGDFGVRLLHWGNRGNAALGDGRFLFIRLDDARWCIRRKKQAGWETVAREWGMETLREYLKAHGPCPPRFNARSEDPSEQCQCVSGDRPAREGGN